MSPKLLAGAGFIVYLHQTTLNVMHQYTKPLKGILFFCNLFLFGCNHPEGNTRYKYIGQVTFRRTYVGHEKWSESELDSVQKSNPTFMYPTHTSEDKMLEILITLGIANKNELFLDKITPGLTDTIFLTNKTFNTDTVFIKYDTARISAAIQIRNVQTTNNIPIEDAPFSHTFSLVAIKDKANPYIVFLNQYYIMNGDNYEVSLYEKK